MVVFDILLLWLGVPIKVVLSRPLELEGIKEFLDQDSSAWAVTRLINVDTFHSYA